MISNLRKLWMFNSLIVVNGRHIKNDFSKSVKEN